MRTLTLQTYGPWSTEAETEMEVSAIWVVVIIDRFMAGKTGEESYGKIVYQFSICTTY